MSVEGKFRTLEQLLVEFPPQSEIFSIQGKPNIEAMVSRNEVNDIVYVVPGSTHFLSPEEEVTLESPEEPTE